MIQTRKFCFDGALKNNLLEKTKCGRNRIEIAQNLKINEDSRNVDVLITRLRKKIINKDGSSFLKTIRGHGYMLKTDYEIEN